MAVKVTQERRVSPGKELELNDLLRELRARALKQPGYISGETLVDAEDPTIHLVIANWFTLRDWQNWERSPGRQELIQKVNALLVSPPRTRVWLERAGGAIPGV